MRARIKLEKPTAITIERLEYGVPYSVCFSDPPVVVIRDRFEARDALIVVQPDAYYTPLCIKSPEDFAGMYNAGLTFEPAHGEIILDMEGEDDDY